MTIITAWSALQWWLGQTPGRGRDTVRPQSMCSRVGGIILWRTHRLEWTRSKKALSSHSASSWEGQGWNWTFCLSAERTSERPQSRRMFWFKLKPRRNIELGVAVVFCRRCGLCVCTCCLLWCQVYLSRSLQMYSMGSSRQSPRFCVISVRKGGKRYSRWVSSLNGLTDLCRIG